MAFSKRSGGIAEKFSCILTQSEPLSASHCVFSNTALGHKLLTQRKAQLRSVELGLIINLAEARKFTQARDSSSPQKR
jgi:hypothetical protein